MINPLTQFTSWFNAAQKTAAKTKEKNSMVLSTASKKGKPSSRTVLLKSFDKNGFVFYTNYESRKGKELLENPHAALLFHWPELERQIHITGKVKKVSRKQSLQYFHSRPRESQLGAWASPQSSTIETHDILEASMQKLREKYSGKEIPLPPHWGGFVVIPKTFEFWQAGKNRLHERVEYRKTGRGWVKRNIAP